MYASVFGRAEIFLDYALRRRGPLTMAPSQLGIFTRSDPNARARQHPVSCPAAVARPLRRAAAHVPGVHRERRQRAADQPRPHPAQVADPADAPAIQPNYLSTDEDRRVAADSIRVTRRIVAQPALQAFHPERISCRANRCGDDDASLAKAAGDVGTTIFHPVGTAKMGRDSDPLAVVDERLRVFGLDGSA